MRTRKITLLSIMALLLVGFMAGCGEERGVVPPTLTSISPSRGTQGQTVPVTLTGTNFTTGATVNVNGALITVSNTMVTSSTTILATFAIASNAVLGTANISVTSAGTVTNTVTFTIGPPFTVTSVVPANGAANQSINSVLSATFSQAVNCATLTTTGASASFTLAGPAGAVAVTRTSCAGSTATFTPSSPLAFDAAYTAMLTTAVQDSLGDPLLSNFDWSFSTTTPPTVTAVTPLNKATGVALNTALTAQFDEAMNPATMIASTFTLATGCAPAATTPLAEPGVTYNVLNNIITLTPTSALAPVTCYTATLNTGAQNLAGAPLAANYVWTFTTGAAPDITPPTIIFTNPLNLATGVPVNQAITATFSKPMLDTTINPLTFTLFQGATQITGGVSYVAGSNTAIFTPNVPLAVDTLYTATVTAGATDLAGNHLVVPSNPLIPPANPWTFTTAAAPVLTPPILDSTNPASTATGVCLNATINATFSTAMNATTFNATSFAVTGPGDTLVPGTFTQDLTGTIITFTPASNLAAGTLYNVAIANTVTDLAGVPLGTPGHVPNPWTFTTASSACLPPASPLGAAAPFGAFGGGAGITNMGTETVINGDIGTTGASSLVTGFHDNLVPYLPPAGCIYTETPLNIGDVAGQIFTAPPPPTITCPLEGTGPATLAGTTAYVATQAAAAALAEYNTLAGMATTGPDPGAATTENLGGLTIDPGVYASASGAYSITGSDLTLDAQGNANAVWVFQMATSLTVGAAAAPRNIILINGASAANVYWQVGSAATINAAGGGTFEGTIIAKAGVVVSTAGNAAITTINGRAIGLNASVTLVNTVINVPGF